MDASAISPVAESRSEAAPAKSNQQPSTESSTIDARYEMLLKWKEEKEQQKKLKEQAKKKPFKYFHVDTEISPFQKMTPPLKKPQIADTKKTASDGKLALSHVQPVTSRVCRLASDTRDTGQHTTRSQTRSLSAKRRDVSGKSSGGHKLSRVAGESSTLPEKVQSLGVSKADHAVVQLNPIGHQMIRKLALKCRITTSQSPVQSCLSHLQLLSQVVRHPEVQPGLLKPCHHLLDWTAAR